MYQNLGLWSLSYLWMKTPRKWVKFGSHTVKHQVPWPVSRHSLSARSTAAHTPTSQLLPGQGKEAVDKLFHSY